MAAASCALAAALIALFLIAPHNNNNNNNNLCEAARILVRSDPTQAAQAAIAASLASARNASATVSQLAKSGSLKPREAAAVSDCIVTVGDSVEELQRSMQALRGGGKRLVMERMKNVQTWVSAALTDENTCMDGFEGMVDGEAKGKIRGEIVKVAQLISNALALVSGLAG